MIISAALASTEAAHGTDHSIFQDPTFWVGVAFCLTVIVLTKLCGKAISNMLQARADGIAFKLDEASKLRRQAEDLLKDYTDRHAKMASTTEEALKSAKVQAEQLKESIVKDFEQKLKNREEAAEKRLTQAAAEATEEVRNKAIAIALRTTEEILSEKLTGEAGQTLIEQAIDTLPELFKDHAA